MITICSECGGRDIYQNVMVSDDIYWCEDCEMECPIEEVEEKEIFRG